MPTDTVPPVEVRDLTIRYRPAPAPAAVDGLNLAAETGEVLVVLGPNGAGKTSTIEALEGYRRPSSGHISVLGLDPVAHHRRLTARIGVMLQRGGVYPMLGPRQVLSLFASYYAEPLGTEALLDLVGLRNVAATPWRHLSGGEQQRLSLALALIGQPQVAFLDEPTAGVDPEGRQAIRAVIANLRSQGVCVLLTTHELDEAERMADRIVIMSSGRIVLEGAPRALTASTSTTGLTFGAPPGLDVAMLAEAIGAGCTAAEMAPGRYRILGASGPAATAALATWLAARDVTMTDLVTGRTLEEVYFAAVGPDALASPAPEGPPATTSRRRRRAAQPEARRRMGRGDNRP